MLLYALLISWWLNLTNNQDTVKAEPEKEQVKTRSVEFINASELTLDKLDSLILKFQKIDSLIKK
jgi:predicted GNAT superfamily acetyltransferase